MKLRILAALTCCVLIGACQSPEEKDLLRGLAYSKNHEFKQAVEYFRRANLRKPQSVHALAAAKEGARVALLELNDFNEAASFLQSIVVNSSDIQERVAAQKQLATIYFEQAVNYGKAVEEINKLLSTQLDEADRIKFKIKLAKAYFFTNNFVQADSEITEFFKSEKQLDEDARFQMLLLRGNVYLAQKDQERTIQTYKDLFHDFPERAVKENAAMTLVIAYEEMKDYKGAIAVLEQMRKYHSTPEYIDMRIKKLTLDQRNLPGAKGMHRK